MRLDLSTWQEVEGYLAGSAGILVPVGSHEQHGPNGLIGTDAICPEMVARTFGEREDVMVGPTLGIGVAQHHLGFPGSVSLRPTTLIAMIRDVVLSLVRHGFDHVYFLNGHGGNIATVQAAFAEIYGEASYTGRESPVSLKLGNWFAGRRVRQLTRDLYGDTDGSHATASEVSLSYHAYPDSAKSVVMSPTVAPNGRFRDAADYRRKFPDGRMGSDPSRSNAADGGRLLEAAVDDLRESYREWLAAPRAPKAV